MDSKRLHDSGRKTFDLAQANKLYSAREFNRLAAAVSDSTGQIYERSRLFLPVRHAITKQDGATAYPAFGDYPNVYPIKWLLIDYARTPGAVSEDVTYLDGGASTPGTTAKDDVVINNYEWGNAASLYTPYIPENCIIQCYFANGQWHTNTNMMTTRFRGLLDGAITSASATASVDGLVPLDGRLMGFSSLTAQNIHDWDGDDNAACRVEWNAYDKQWELFQLDCPAA